MSAQLLGFRSRREICRAAEFVSERVTGLPVVAGEHSFCIKGVSLKAQIFVTEDKWRVRAKAESFL